MQVQNTRLAPNIAVMIVLLDPMDIHNDVRGSVNPPKAVLSFGNMTGKTKLKDFPCTLEQDWFCGIVLLQDTSSLEEQHLCKTELLRGSIEGLTTMP